MYRVLDRFTVGGPEVASVRPGLVVFRKGDRAQAEIWWREAAGADHTWATNNLGNLLREQVELEAAAALWRKAAETGDPKPALRLGKLLSEQGDREAAVMWFRTAAEAGDPEAMYRLAAILEETGHADDARLWFRRSFALRPGYRGRRLIDLIRRLLRRHRR